MDLSDIPVLHKVFGKGSICECDEDTVSVSFGSGIKKFIFPDAFRNHLILTDIKGKQYVDGILKNIDRENKLRAEKDLRDVERRKLFSKLPLHKSSQAAFGFIDNNMQDVLDNWSVFIGNYRSGYNRGNPRTPSRIYPNSACLLTYLGEKEPEENRLIWGVFMADEDFSGPDCNDGIIPAHKKFRIILDENERKGFPFWSYFDSELKPGKLKWGSVEAKYFSNNTMAQILYDILAVKQGTEQQKLCEGFIEYFCEMNKINIKQLKNRTEREKE